MQSKAWTSKFVGVKEIRGFLCVMTHEKIAKGFYMTSGEFSSNAKTTAKANKITIINGELFLAVIKKLPDNSEKILLALATEGNYTTPSCPACGTKMVKLACLRGDFGDATIGRVASEGSMLNYKVKLKFSRLALTFF